MTLPIEVIAMGSTLAFWVPVSVVKQYIWSFLFFALITGINMLGARGFGELEYVLSLIKVIAIIFFLVLGTLIWFGIPGYLHISENTGPLCFTNWQNGGAIHGDSVVRAIQNIGIAFATAFFSYSM